MSWCCRQLISMWKIMWKSKFWQRKQTYISYFKLPKYKVLKENYDQQQAAIHPSPLMRQGCRKTSSSREKNPWRNAHCTGCSEYIARSLYFLSVIGRKTDDRTRKWLPNKTTTKQTNIRVYREVTLPITLSLFKRVSTMKISMQRSQQTTRGHTPSTQLVTR